jgi:hypothetical protein
MEIGRNSVNPFNKAQDGGPSIKVMRRQISRLIFLTQRVHFYDKTGQLPTHGATVIRPVN